MNIELLKGFAIVIAEVIGVTTGGALLTSFIVWMARRGK